MHHARKVVVANDDADRDKHPLAREQFFAFFVGNLFKQFSVFVEQEGQVVIGIIIQYAFALFPNRSRPSLKLFPSFDLGDSSNQC